MNEYERIRKIANDSTEREKCVAYLRANTKDGDKKGKRLALIKYIREIFKA